MHVQGRSPYQQAVGYCLAVVAVALGVLGVARAVSGPDIPIGVFIAFPLVVFAGAIGAQIETYRQWRRNAGWRVWQGAGWFLFTLFVVFLSSTYGAFRNH